MDISRRSALTAITAGTALTGLAACSEAQSSGPDKKTTSKQPLPDTPSGLLLNKSRAARVLEENKVDLLICSQARNVYYLTNQVPMTSRLGMGDYSYAVLSAKRPDRPVFITGRYNLYLGGAADTDVFNDIDFKLFSYPEDPVGYGGFTDIQDIINAPVTDAFYPKQHQDAALPPHIQRKKDRDIKAKQAHFATLEGGLLKQLLDTDFKHKTIAIDDPKIRETIAKTDLDVRIVDGDRLVKKMRLQKSANEIILHRYAARANARSARLAAHSIGEGATLQDMRGEFFRRCGEQTMKPVYMLIDSIVPELVPREIKRGRTLMIDCVSEFQGYHGDFGRTVCVGEPSRKMKQVTDGLSYIWDRLLPEVKAGKKYSDLHALAAKLYGETNLDTGFAINPHNVGLQHTDEPSRADFGLWMKDDIELQENMILSIDMPLLNNGIGGTAHLEDLVLIGKDGAELLNTSDDRLIIV